MTEPTDALQQFQSIKKVRAGEITEVRAMGCLVRGSDGEPSMRYYDQDTTRRFTPSAGDFWIAYPDGYQSLSPRKAFVEGYVAIGPAPMVTEKRA
jgi:hypothetical protein